MRKLIKSISAVVLSGIAVAAGTASAAHNGYSGTLCNPINSTEDAKIGYSQFGVQNNASSTASVECGGLPNVGSDIFNVQATVYDRNAATNLCCTMRVLNNDGLFLASSTPCTVGSGAASMLLNWVPPVNAAGSFDMGCTIPPNQAGSVSHVTTYRIQSNP
jgi:hypothetical protein